ncbi:autotransporter domain-containing protein [Roseiarcus fermentans]|uniref:autotransporter family protein n=1 Tax=Roseiarcus fermentans TaxID=1473586 RepID=UPI001FDF04F9|nr:autotransporter domain-containing protein [Roseiarcus fermentans]
MLNLLSPFLSLNGSTVGQTTLSDNLAQAISVNTSAALAAQELSYSDKNLLGSAVNTVTGVAGAFGVAANLGGGLPNQPAPAGGTVPGVQPVGGLGTQLGAIYASGVNAYAAGDHSSLASTVGLLTSAYSFTSSDLGVAKNYFANGNKSNNAVAPYGGVVAVAPSGYTLPTYALDADGYPVTTLPNTTYSVYDLAYGVSNTQSGQNVYGSSRPAQVAPSQFNLFDPTALNGINTNPAFPSGHTTYAFTDSILIGMMVPQEFQSMLSRAAEYANSRIVLGVHYPLDIIASRSFVQYDLAQAFTNPAYINNATTTGTAINLPSLFTAAQSELTGYLSAQCGASVATCASSSANTTNDPYVPSAANAATYAANLTYGLPTLTYTQAPREQAPSGGPDASILLASLYGGSTSAAQAIAPNGGIDASLQTSTINQIVVNTEGQALAAFYGTALSYWSRVNLYAAAGYFSGVTGVLTMASSDVVNMPVTIAGTGVLVDNGRINGATNVQSGGALGGVGSVAGNVAVQSGGSLSPGGFTPAGVQASPGALSVAGNLVLSAGAGYGVVVAGSTASKTAVTGSASLGGAVNATFALGSTFSRTYTILTAGSVSGTFAGVANSGLPAGLTDTLSYDGSDAYLTLQVGSSIPGGLNRNQQAVANALNASLIQAGSLPTVYALTAAGLTQASGEIATAPRLAVSQAGGGFVQSFFDGGLSDPDARYRTGADIAMFYAPLPTKKSPALSAIPAPFSPYWTVWSTTFAGHASVDGQAGVGSNTASGTNWTEVVGVEYRMARDTAVGFGFGGGSTNFSVAGGGGSGSYSFGEIAAYATHEFNAVYLTGALGGGAGSIKTNRTDPLAEQLQGSFNASNFAGRVELGDKLAVAPGAVLSPYAAVQVNYASLPSYNEGSWSQFSLAYASQNATDTSTELGFRVKQDFAADGALFTVGGRLAWGYNFNTTEQASAAFLDLPGSNFTVYGASPARNAALANVGGKVAFGNGIAIEARFDGQFGSGTQVYGGRGTVSYSF